MNSKSFSLERIFSLIGIYTTVRKGFELAIEGRNIVLEKYREYVRRRQARLRRVHRVIRRNGQNRRNV